MAQAFKSLQFNNPTTEDKKKSRKERKRKVLEDTVKGVKAKSTRKGTTSYNTMWDNFTVGEKIQLTLEGKGKWSINEDGNPNWSIFGSGTQASAKAQEKLTKITDREKAKQERQDKRTIAKEDSEAYKKRQQSLSSFSGGGWMDSSALSDFQKSKLDLVLSEEFPDAKVDGNTIAIEDEVYNIEGISLVDENREKKVDILRPTPYADPLATGLRPAYVEEKGGGTMKLPDRYDVLLTRQDGTGVVVNKLVLPFVDPTDEGEEILGGLTGFPDVEILNFEDPELIQEIKDETRSALDKTNSKRIQNILIDKGLIGESEVTIEGTGEKKLEPTTQYDIRPMEKIEDAPVSILYKNGAATDLAKDIINGDIGEKNAKDIFQEIYGDYGVTVEEGGDVGDELIFKIGSEELEVNLDGGIKEAKSTAKDVHDFIKANSRKSTFESYDKPTIANVKELQQRANVIANQIAVANKEAKDLYYKYSTELVEIIELIVEDPINSVSRLSDFLENNPKLEEATDTFLNDVEELTKKIEIKQAYLNDLVKVQQELVANLIKATKQGIDPYTGKPAGEGTIAGFIGNTATKTAVQSIGGAATSALRLLSLFGPAWTDEGSKAVEDTMREIRGNIKALSNELATDTEEEYIRRLVDDSIIAAVGEQVTRMGAQFVLSGFNPYLMFIAMTGEMTYQNEEIIGINQNIPTPVKGATIFSTGLIGGLLERAGFQKMLPKSTTKRAIPWILSKIKNRKGGFPKTRQELAQAIGVQVEKLAYAVQQGGEAAFVETITEVAQEGVNKTAVEILTAVYEEEGDSPLFDSQFRLLNNPKLLDQMIEIIKISAATGGLMGSIGGVVDLNRENKLRKINAKEFNKLMTFVKDPAAVQAFEIQMVHDLMKGASLADVQAKVNSLKEIQDLIEQIPTNLDEDTKQKIFLNLKKIKALEAYISKYNGTLVKAEKQQIEDLKKQNEELAADPENRGKDLTLEERQEIEKETFKEDTKKVSKSIDSYIAKLNKQLQKVKGATIFTIETTKKEGEKGFERLKEKIKKEYGEDAAGKMNPNEPAQIIQSPSGKFKSFIIINKPVLIRQPVNPLDVIDHEVGHFLFEKALLSNPELASELKKSLRDHLLAEGKNDLVKKLDKRIDEDYVEQDKAEKKLAEEEGREYTPMTQSDFDEEWVMNFIQMDSIPDPSFWQKLLKLFNDLMATFGVAEDGAPLLESTDGESIYNFLKGIREFGVRGEVKIDSSKKTEDVDKDVSATSKSSKKLSPEQSKTVEESILELKQEIKENEEIAAKFGKEPVPTAKQRRLEESILKDQLKPTIDSFVESQTKRLFDPIAPDARNNVTRQAFRESMVSDIETMIIKEFEQKQDIEKFITSRGYLRANSLAKRLGIKSVEQGIDKDIDQAKGVAAETETITVDEKKPTKQIKLKERLGNDAIEITEEVKERGKDIDLETVDFKSLKDLTPEMTQEMFGISPKPGNLSKADVRNAQQFISKHADVLIAMLPEGSTPSGTSTGVQKVLLDAFYTKGDRAVMAKTGSKAGLQEQTKRNDITKEEFLELFGITPAGQPNISDRNTSSKIKALVAQTGRMLTNQALREQAEDTGKTVPSKVFEGKAKTMFAKAAEKEAEKLINNKNVLETSDEVLIGEELIKEIGTWRGLVDAYKGVEALDLRDENDLEEYKNWVLTEFAKRLPKEFFKAGFFSGGRRTLESGALAWFGKEDFNKSIKTVEQFGEFDQDIINAATRVNDGKIIVKDSNGKNKKVKFGEKEFTKFADSKLRGLKKVFEIFQDMIVDDPQNIKYIGQFLSSTSANMSQFIRVAAPWRFMQQNLEGKKTIEEHTLPVSFTAKYLFERAIEENVDDYWYGIEQNFFQGLITKANDDKLKDLPGQPKRKLRDFPPKEQAYDILIGNDSIWLRYFNDFVNNNKNGFNANEIVLENGKTIAQEFKVEVDKKFQQDPNVIQFQNGLIEKVLLGEDIKSQQEMDIFTEKLAKEKKKANSKNSLKLKDSKVVKVNENAPTSENIREAEVLDKALNIARDPNAPVKKIRVFDFDDTLARTKSNVLYTMPDGTTGKLTAEEFAKKGSEMLEQGAVWDFSEFNKVMEGKEGPLLGVARLIQQARGTKDVFVLTARSQEAAPAIKEFLDSVGLNIPIENITGLGDSSPLAKSNWVVDKAADGYNDFYFADDHMGNVDAVQKALAVMEAKAKVQQAKIKFSLNTKRDLKWKTIGGSFNIVEADFEVDGKDYQIEIKRKDVGHIFSKLEDHFSTLGLALSPTKEIADDNLREKELSGGKPKILDASFYRITDNFYTGIEKDVDLTGEGNAAEVISIVVNGLVDKYKKTKGAQGVTFTAYEPSRTRLYRTLANMFGEKLGLKVLETEFDGSETSTEFLLLDKTLFEEVKRTPVTKLSKQSKSKTPAIKFSLNTKRDLKWKLIEKPAREGGNVQEALFKVKGKDYLVDANVENIEDLFYKLEDMVGMEMTESEVEAVSNKLKEDNDVKPKIIETSFYRTRNRPSGRDGKDIDLTGEGDAAEVLSIVVNGLVEKYKNTEGAQGIAFTSFEPSRTRLYRTIANLFARKLNLKVLEKEGDGNYIPTGFILLDKNLIETFEETPAIKFSKQSKPVQTVLDVVDVKSDVQKAKTKFSKTVDQVMNTIIFQKTGIQQYKEFAEVSAQAKGRGVKSFDLIPPSAQDFGGLLYKLLSKGELGDKQWKWMQEHLIRPYGRAMNDLSVAQNQLMADFKALKQSLSGVPKNLKKKAFGGFTNEDVVRITTWDRQGIKVDGISKRDLDAARDYVANKPDLNNFIDQLIAITKGDGYYYPGKNWLAGTITTDFREGLRKVARKNLLEQWQENVDLAFNESNMNKIEAEFGPKYREALEDSLRRMSTGQNRAKGMSRIEQRFADYINNSVGAVMFLNARSAVLQTISAVNFINWNDNNPMKAAQAFANQPQYWKDFMKLMNSDFLVDRRNGLKINVSESEIAEAAKTSKNKVKGVIAYLLNKGFVFTQIADSFAIASGGATLYRNRIKTYKKQGLSENEAIEKAFLDFRELAEESQQSARADKISQQQASTLGRLVLAFANTPSQYARIMDKAGKDLIAGRGDWKSNMSKIAYYGFVQNLLFTTLQSALFAYGMDDDEEEDAKVFPESKMLDAANSMADNLLRGIGVGGVILAQSKNTIIGLIKRSEKDPYFNPDASGFPKPEYTDAVDKLLAISPPVSIKLRKIKGGITDWYYNRWRPEASEPFNINNPNYRAGSKVIAGVSNVPLDRLFQKLENIQGALDATNPTWKRIFMALGWPKWQLENEKEKEERKAKDKAERASIKKTQSGPKFKSANFKKAKFKTP